jgi:hypothetical protein
MSGGLARVTVSAEGLERRRPQTRELLLARVRSEFVEMPGLNLTLTQATRLFGLPPDICTRVLGTLQVEGLLIQGSDERYARRSSK